jgi:DNA-directed RNA polymerase subunit M/transcription elongation factor TFIIS
VQISDLNALKCRKCGAGKASLRLKEELLLDGTRLESVVCLVCSERQATREVPPSVQARPLHAKDTGPFTGHKKAPCAVRECPEEIASTFNRSGLCARCSNLLRTWERGKKTTPAPFVKCGKGYKINPLRKGKGDAESV